MAHVDEAARYAHVIQAVRETPWAILPATLDTIVELVRMRAGGARFTDEEIRARIGNDRQAPTVRQTGRVQVIPVFGVISHRMNMFSSISGGTSTEQLAADLKAALDDAGVGTILLDIDSPGGNVLGIQELGDAIFSARGRKPIVAVANASAASAAYWLASQADEIVVTPSGQVGSIGCLGVHEDLSKQAEMAGVKVTYVTAGKFKGERQPFEPLSDVARAAMQARVDQYYGTFRDAVARGRGVTAAAVEQGFGEGRMVSATDALKLGMVDRVETLQATLDRLNGTATPSPAPAPVRRPAMTDGNGAGASAGPVRDGEIIVTVGQLRDLQAKAARLDRLETVETQLKDKHAEIAQLTEAHRKERIDNKVSALKVPAFRPVVRHLYDLAARASLELTYTMSDGKTLAAEGVVDQLVAEINRSAEVLFQTLSTRPAAVATDEPEEPGARVEHRTRKYMAANTGATYKAALDEVLKADPELKEAYVRS